MSERRAHDENEHQQDAIDDQRRSRHTPANEAAPAKTIFSP